MDHSKAEYRRILRCMFNGLSLLVQWFQSFPDFKFNDLFQVSPICNFSIVFEILKQYHPIQELNFLNVEEFTTVMRNKRTCTHSNSATDSNPPIPTQNTFQNLEQDHVDNSEIPSTNQPKKT